MQAEARLAFRLALAHHPLCGWFRNDRAGPLCSGCIVFWPAALLALPAAVEALRRGASPWALLGAAVVLGLPHLLSLRWRDRLARVAIKAMGGAGVATATLCILVLPVAWPWRVGLVALEFAAFGGWLALRARSMLRVCDACPWHRDWAHCPGFPLGAGSIRPGIAAAAHPPAPEARADAA